LRRLDIEHHGQGRATLLDASWGAEAELNPAALSFDPRRMAIVHIAALRSAQRQLDFAQACRARGAPRLSAGTYARLVQNENVLRYLTVRTDEGRLRRRGTAGDAAGSGETEATGGGE